MLQKKEPRVAAIFCYQEIKLHYFERAKCKLESEICSIIGSITYCLQSRFGLLAQNDCDTDLIFQSACEGRTLRNAIYIILNTKMDHS